MHSTFYYHIFISLYSVFAIQPTAKMTRRKDQTCAHSGQIHTNGIYMHNMELTGDLSLLPSAWRIAELLPPPAVRPKLWGHKRERSRHLHSLLPNENDFVCLFVSLLHILHTKHSSFAHLSLIKPYYIQLKAICSPTSHSARRSRCKWKKNALRAANGDMAVVSVSHITYPPSECVLELFELWATK